MLQYTEMENLTARFLHADHQVQMEEGRYCRDFRLSMWTSPVYRISEDGQRGAMSCDTFTYRFYRGEDGRDRCRVLMKRLENRFACEDGNTTMTDIRWSTTQEMLPWMYETEFPYETLRDWPRLPGHRGGDAQEILAIRNLQNLVLEHRLHDCGHFFTADGELWIDHCTDHAVRGKEAIRKWSEEFLTTEEQNRHCYRFLAITGMPVIEPEEEDGRASGIFMTELFRIDASSENREEWKLYRHLGFIRSRYVKEHGVWRIARMELKTAADLPVARYRNDLRYDKSGQSREPWNLDQLPDGSISESDACEAERIVNGWVLACRRGTLMDYSGRYFHLPHGEPSMLIRSFGAGTRKLVTLEQVEEKLAQMTSQYRNRYYTFHAPTTPVIQYEGDRDHMIGTWYDCGTTSLRSDASSPEDIPYMIFVNKYVHRFTRIDGVWYFSEFFGEPAIAMPDWHFDMTHSRGYVSLEDTEAYPQAFTAFAGD